MIQAARRATTTCRRWSSASARTSPRQPSRADSVRSTTSAARSPSMSDGSTKTRAARSCSTSSRRTSRETAGRLTLVLIGNSLLEIPEHPRIRHLGFLDDADKFDAIAASELLIMPSYFESLSMVALEAWALGRPVLANAQMRRAEGTVHPQQRRSVLRRPRRIRRLAARDRTEPLAGRRPRPERPPVLSRPLRLAGHRAQVSRHASSACRKPAAATTQSVARLARAAEGRLPAGAEVIAAIPAGPSISAEQYQPRPIGTGFTTGAAACCRNLNAAPAPRDHGRRHFRNDRRGSSPARQPPMSRTPGRSSGAGDARIRRCDRPRSAGHPARAASRRLRIGHLRRDRRPAARAADPRLSRARRRQRIPTISCSTIFRSDPRRRAPPTRCRIGWRSSTTTSRRLNTSPPCTATLARQCFRGRRELHAYVDRCDLAMGDSEFNRQDLEALGFPRTAVLPVVPDLAHLDDPADWFVARQFDDDWTNIVFVGRVIANKKIEDLIRSFHAYQHALQSAQPAADRRRVQRVRALLRRADAPGRRNCDLTERAFRRPCHGRRADRLLRHRRPVSLRQRARRLLRAAGRSVLQAGAGPGLRRDGGARRPWTAAECSTTTRIRAMSPR